MRYTGIAAIFLLTATVVACNDGATPAAPTPDDPDLITNGTPTGSAYGNVGALIVDEDANGVLDFICSGSLIAPTVFLTARHCTADPPAVYYVSFAPDVVPLPAALIVSTEAHASATDDIGVVILSASETAGIPTLDLPEEGLLDALKKRGVLARTPAVVVGYGVASLNRGPRTSGLDGVRKVATTKVLSLQGPFLLLADAHGQSGSGGTCGGDSGGPVFLEGQDPDVIVAITAFGFPRGCHAIGGYIRLDTPSALAFLDDYVTVP
jgi:Trypsin